MRASVFFRCILLVSILLSVTGCDSIQKTVFKFFMEPSAPDAPEGVEVIRDLVFT